MGKEGRRSLAAGGGFDGFYTYFATGGFTYGSTTSHWPELAEWARAHDKLFVPCVAPGYIDTRIRPRNSVNTRDRERGAYYDRVWSAALAVARQPGPLTPNPLPFVVVIADPKVLLKVFPRVLEVV